MEALNEIGEMLSKPATFHEFLMKTNHIDEIYDALAIEDTSEVVMRAMNILRRTNQLPPIYRNTKCELMSMMNRNAGNAAFQNGLFQQALALYNLALLFAPKYSREMKLAYSNRSALFFKLQAYIPCINDINRCFAMGCPEDIEEKLTKRKDLVVPQLIREELSKQNMIRTVEKCINPNSMKPNKIIPCASADIKIDITTPKPRVIASANIDVGDIVVSENAYVSFTDIKNVQDSCHFCQRKALDLIPCDDCCYALFCNEECQNKCFKEYHEYECKIIEVIRALCFGPMPNLMVKACLKLRTLSKSWGEIISASSNMGIKRTKSSSVEEIYDTNKIYSILCFNDDRTFMYGTLYNACFVCAAILHYLDNCIPTFLPKDPVEKQQALRAFARIMMFLAVHQKPLHIHQAQTNLKLDRSHYGEPNFGLFSFIAKLKNDCNANLLIANNNNKLVLIALRPINKGEELTIPFIWHRKDPIQLDRQLYNVTSFLFIGTVCGCDRCNKKCIQTGKDGDQLSMYQKKYISDLNVKEIQFKLKTIDITYVYPIILKALKVLNDVPNSQEYFEIYSYFCRCVFFFEAVYSSNYLLDSAT